MKTLLIQVGKTDGSHIAASIDDYVGRIAHYMPFEVVTIRDVRRGKSVPEERQRAMEGEQIMRLLCPGDVVTLLDERGLGLRSVEFAAWLERKRATASRLVFVIGGPYGFSPEVYARADERISLSKMTFSHQLVRLIFAEQLYRACTIIKGEPYHHE